MAYQCEATRFEQLDNLSRLCLYDQPVLVHGSVAHAVIRGSELPSEFRFDGSRRDIDIFVPQSAGKLAVEGDLGMANVGNPAPLDAGLCGVIVYKNGIPYAVKSGIEVPLEDDGLLSQRLIKEIAHTDGCHAGVFTPEGLLAVHRVEPYRRLVSHRREDNEFELWARETTVDIPRRLQESIDEFHRIYRDRYPLGLFYRQVSELYSNVVPERYKKHLRKGTHRFMRKVAGRDDPYQT